MSSFKAQSAVTQANITVNDAVRAVTGVIPVTMVTTDGSSMDPDGQLPIMQFFKISGSLDLAVDGSVTPQVAVCQPAAGVLWYINLLSIVILKATSRPDYYGGIDLSAGTGCLVQLKGKIVAGGPDVVMFDLTADKAIKSLADYTAAGGEEAQIISTGVTPDLTTVRYPFTTRNRKAVELDGDLDQRLEFTIQDDLTGLDQHNVSVLGGAVTK